MSASPVVKALRPVPKFIGVCVRAGTMDKAIKVRTAKQKNDPYLKKHFKIWPTYIVHDPYNSCRTGDIVRFQQFPCASKSKRIQHAVTEILAAFGPRLDERPPVMSKQEQEEKLRVVAERQQWRRDRRLEEKKASALTRMMQRVALTGKSPARSSNPAVREIAKLTFEDAVKAGRKWRVDPEFKPRSEALSRDKKETREYWEQRRQEEASASV